MNALSRRRSTCASPTRLWPAVALFLGTVHLRGGINGGSTGSAFTLPAGFRPNSNVYVPVNLCNAKKGRLPILSNGVVSVQAQENFADAQCFTSLDEVSFAVSAFGYTPLTLLNNWSHAPFNTRDVAVRVAKNNVQFQGAMAGGSTAVAFTLPFGFRPNNNVYVPVALCDAEKGCLHIQPNGTVTVQARNALADAQCFTS